jgi:hypothetical protein
MTAATLTPEQVDHLSLDELRVEVAKARGWYGVGSYTDPLSGTPYLGGHQQDIDDHGFALMLPDYARDISAAWELEEDIKQRGLEIPYGLALARAVAPIAHSHYGLNLIEAGHFFVLAHATPEERTRAYLKAINHR